MLRLGEFLGISCETLALAKVSEHAGYLKNAVPDSSNRNPSDIIELDSLCAAAEA